MSSIIYFCLLCIINIYAQSKYKIGTFNQVIINPAFPSHEIPIFVYYPIVDKTVNIKFATIVFAHGFECNALWYPWIYENIVPYGYIVAYINSFERGAVNGTQFAIDQRYALKWLNTIVNNNKSSILYSKINTNKSMGSGHSEGGGASLKSMGSQYINDIFDNKYKFSSLFTMAPCGQNDEADDAKNIPNGVPVFAFTGTMDCICPSQEAFHLFNNIPETDCKYYADVANATHCHWLDPPFIEQDVCTDAEKDLCQELHPNNNITIPLKKQIDIATQYMLLFLNSTIINNSDHNDLEKITDQLNKDKANGQMFNVIVSNAC